MIRLPVSSIAECFLENLLYKASVMLPAGAASVMASRIDSRRLQGL